MFKATISKTNLLIDSISTIADIIDEGLFKINKEGISLIAADRAMVAVVDFKISSSAFDSYHVDGDHAIGLNLSNLLSVLKRASGNDKITLTLQDSSKLEISMQNSTKRKFVVPIINLSQEDVPPIDQLEFTSTAELSSEALQRGIDDADIVSDAVIFEAKPDKLIMRAEGDMNRAELEMEKGDKNLLKIDVDGTVKVGYPLEYLKKMIKAAKISDSVKIYFGQDYPMKLEFKSGDKVQMNFVLAPRVTEE